MKKFFVSIIVVCTSLLVGCGAFENFVESDPAVDMLGLDYSACVGGGFDVCLEFLSDNDEVLLGQDLSEFVLGILLESVDGNGNANTVEPL